MVVHAQRDSACQRLYSGPMLLADAVAAPVAESCVPQRMEIVRGRLYREYEPGWIVQRLCYGRCFGRDGGLEEVHQTRELLPRPARNFRRWLVEPAEHEASLIDPALETIHDDITDGISEAA